MRYDFFKNADYPKDRISKFSGKTAVQIAKYIGGVAVFSCLLIASAAAIGDSLLPEHLLTDEEAETALSGVNGLVHISYPYSGEYTYSQETPSYGSDGNQGSSFRDPAEDNYDAYDSSDPYEDEENWWYSSWLEEMDTFTDTVSSWRQQVSDFFSVSYTIAYSGVIESGISNQITDAKVDNDAHTITVSLPDPVVLDNHIRYDDLSYTGSSFFSSTLSEEDLNSAIEVIESAELDKALAAGLYEQVRTLTESAVRNALSAYPDYEIIIA